MFKAWRARRRLRKDEDEAYELGSRSNRLAKTTARLERLREAMACGYCPIVNRSCKWTDCLFCYSGAVDRHSALGQFGGVRVWYRIDPPRCKLCRD